MIEARAVIEDLKETKKKILDRGGVFRGYYSFRDHVFNFSFGNDSEEYYARLRVYEANNWPTKAFVFERKMTKKIDSKVYVYGFRREFDSFEEANDFLSRYFGKTEYTSFDYFREGWEYAFGKERIFVEDIKELGLSVEIESDSDEKIERIFEMLDVKERFGKSVADTIKKKKFG